MQTLSEIEKQRFDEFSAKVNSQISEIREFIKAEIKTNTDLDFWSQFGEEIDIHFCENEDHQSENFGNMEFWMYPVVKDAKGFDSTDTSIFCEVKLI